MVIEDKATQVAYACKCLNVRVTPFPSPSEGSDYPHNPNYIPIFVRDDSIQVVSCLFLIEGGGKDIEVILRITRRSP